MLSEQLVESVNSRPRDNMETKYDSFNNMLA